MEDRLSSVRNLLTIHSLDAILISSVPNIIYLTNYAGFSPLEREALILLTAKKAYLITDARYSEAVRVQIPYMTIVEITGQHLLSDLIKDIAYKEYIDILGFEDDDLSVREYEKIKHSVKQLRPVSLHTLRITKNGQALHAISAACRIGDKTFSHILSFLTPGITEQEISLEMEIFIKRQNADVSFPTIVAFGANSAVPHHHTGKRKLKQNDIVLMDFGVKYNNFCSDMTRTVFVGKPTKEQEKIYETVLRAQQIAIQQCDDAVMKQSNSIKASDIDKAAREYIISQGYPSIPHSLGHGIGLEVHEAPALSPLSKDKLTEGMVFSIEPGIYLPGKFGIRIEDLFTIQHSKLVRLTKSQNDFTQV